MESAPIARSARRFRFVVLTAIALIAIIYVIGRMGPQVGPFRVETHPDVPGWLGVTLTDVTLLLFVVALVRLAQMLGAIADGPLFGPPVIKAFRGFAFWLFLATLIDVVAAPVISIVQAVRAGGGPAQLVFELRDLLMLLGALFLFLLARMLEQARSLETELEEIV